MGENVAIIGASPKPARYAFKAQQMLHEYGHTTFPVSQRGHDVLGVAGYCSVVDINECIDTITLYINATIHERYVDAILQVNPKRIIFNPGTESTELMVRYRERGIDAFEACTLVLLRTGQF